MIKIIQGNSLDKLKELPAESVDTCITSPPYYNLRDYQQPGQLGLEDTFQDYIDNLVEVFEEVKRVLKPEGTLWLNLGDSYSSSPTGSIGKSKKQKSNMGSHKDFKRNKILSLPQKNLIGIPFRVAFALQAAGWYLRQDIIWNKPNPMPESVKDRCTKAHEYIFLLSKSPKYYFDNEAIKEDAKFPDGPNTPKSIKAVEGVYSKNLQKIGANPKRNKRSVWTVTTKPYKGAHFATFPMDLIEPCVLAGCPETGIVLDPFGGSGTTGIVASNLNRNAILVELNPEYIELAKQRIEKQGGLFCDLQIISGDSKGVNG